MKQIAKIFTVMLIGTMLLISCDDAEKQMFNNNDAFFSFETGKSSILENDIRTLRIPVSLSKTTGVGEVTFDIETEEYDNPAVEGVDYIVKTTNRTISFEGDWIKNIEIKMIDNDHRDNDKKFKIVLKDNNIGASIGLANNTKTSHVVTISDNEHPLAALIGANFESTEQSIMKDDNGDFIAPYVLPVEIRGDTILGRDNRLLIKGLLGLSQEVRVQLDMETGEVIMEGEKYYNVIDPYFGMPIELTFFGWTWDVDEEGNDVVKRYTQVLGTFDMDKQEIVFDTGYLTQITAPSDHPYVGKAYNTLVINYCRIAKKQ